MILMRVVNPTCVEVIVEEMSWVARPWTDPWSILASATRAYLRMKLDLKHETWETDGRA